MASAAIRAAWASCFGESCFVDVVVSSSFLFRRLLRRGEFVVVLEFGRDEVVFEEEEGGRGCFGRDDVVAVVVTPFRASFCS